RLPLPRRDHRMVDAMLRCQLRQRQVTPDRFQRHLCLELRAVALPRLLHFPSIPQVGISLAPCPNFRDHLTLSKAAERLDLQEQTARTYLKHIFEKTDTHRQAQLVELMLKSAVRLTSDVATTAFT